MKVNKEQFITKIAAVKEASSITGKRYFDIKLEGNSCSGIRESTGKSFKIDLNKLYKGYLECETITISALKLYVDRVQSPSYAILKTVGLL